MLPAKNRLNLLYLHQRSRIPKKRLESTDLLIRFAKANDFKAAIVVSKKIAKKAVDRNRIRRLLSEALNEYKEKISAHMIIYAKKNLADKKRGEVVIMLQNLFAKYV